MTGLFETLAHKPLADRMRPASLGEVVGQDALLGQNGPLARMIENDTLSSFILWGPPGCGKTTIARILAEKTKLTFVQLSAVFSGVSDLRKVFDEAKRTRMAGRGIQVFSFAR